MGNGEMMVGTNVRRCLKIIMISLLYLTTSSFSRGCRLIFQAYITIYHSVTTMLRSLIGSPVIKTPDHIQKSDLMEYIVVSQPTFICSR